MNGFDKAVARIENMKAEHGAYPIDLTLVQYDDARDFNLAFPEQDYLHHCEQMDNLRSWCGERNIEIIMMPFDPELMKGGEENSGQRARAAILPPYKLGLDLHTESLGWALVELSRESDQRGDRKPVGLGIPLGKMGKD